MAELQAEGWCACTECAKFYAMPLMQIYMRTDEKPILCPQGHPMTYSNNGTRWERLTGLYYLLDSLYSMPKVVSFNQLEQAYAITRELKEKE